MWNVFHLNTYLPLLGLMHVEGEVDRSLDEVVRQVGVEVLTQHHD